MRDKQEKRKTQNELFIRFNKNILKRVFNKQTKKNDKKKTLKGLHKEKKMIENQVVQ